MNCPLCQGVLLLLKSILRKVKADFCIEGFKIAKLALSQHSMLHGYLVFVKGLFIYLFIFITIGLEIFKSPHLSP